MGFVEARVLDSTHLELSKPIDIPAGKEVKITVLSQEEYDKERDVWIELSHNGISSAYGNSEPEYPSSSVKEKNEEYDNEGK